jgi:hypothetical protein
VPGASTTSSPPLTRRIKTEPCSIVTSPSSENFSRPYPSFVCRVDITRYDVSFVAALNVVDHVGDRFYEILAPDSNDELLLESDPILSK